jgi:hypothetical protein
MLSAGQFGWLQEPPLMRLVAWHSLLLVALLLGSPDAMVRAAAPPPAKVQLVTIKETIGPQGRHNAALAKVLARTVDFYGLDDPKTTLVEALDQLAKVHRLRFVINAKAFKGKDLDDWEENGICNPNAIPAMKAPLSTVLKKILARVRVASGAIYILRRDGIEITTNACWFRELGLPADTTSELVSLDLRKVRLDRALARIGVRMIDPRIEKRAGVRVTVRLHFVPQETALELLADMAGLVVVRKSGILYLTSPSNAAQLNNQGAKVVRTVKTLTSDDEPRVGDARAGLRPSGDFRKAPLNRAIAYVRDQSDVNILIDARVEKKTRARMTARLDRVPVATALELLADMAGLAVVKRANVYYITSSANAQQLRKQIP